MSRDQLVVDDPFVGIKTVSSLAGKLKIVNYHPDLRDHFFKINYQWINSMFEMEEIDLMVLKDPDNYIIKPGGFIWFVATSENEILGTCALKKTDTLNYELTKMGVLEKARGLKAGEFLLKHVISFVRESKIPNCYLLTNKKCEAAIYLYEKNGFTHDSDIMKKFGRDYKRADVAMKLLPRGKDS